MTLWCSGRINLMEIPVLLHMLHYWKTAFLKYDRHHSGKTSSFNLRLILWDAGLSVSNKVLECLVLRWAENWEEQINIETFSFRFAKNKLVSSENYVTVMIRLHLAHGKKEIFFSQINFIHPFIFQSGFIVLTQKWKEIHCL